MPRNLKVIPSQLTSIKKEWSPLLESLKVLPLFYALEIKTGAVKTTGVFPTFGQNLHVDLMEL